MRGMGLYVLVFALVIGIVVYEKFYKKEKPNEFDDLVGKKITLVGTLAEEQEKREFNTRITVWVDVMYDKPASAKASAGKGEKILVTTGGPKDFYYGDTVRIKGELTKPENFYTNTGREFDYNGYLDSNDIHFIVRNASVTQIGHDPPNKILAGLFFVRRTFVASIKRMLPEPQSSLAAGILIDGKGSISADWQDKFIKTGLVHVVVLSGSNVSIVAAAFSRALAFLPRFFGLFGAAAGIILFALITGASSTVIRASIMALLAISSKFVLRKYDPARGLFIASFLMLIQNPTILIHSPSFQLSFLATFTVVKIIPRVEVWFEKFIRHIPEKFGIREIVVSNIVVQLYLLPFLTWTTGFVSAVSLPVNLLVLPLVPLTMLSSFLTGLTGLVSHIFSLPFAFVSQILLSYELGVVDFFSKFSLSQISFNVFSTWTVILFYSVSIVVFLLPNGSLFGRKGNHINGGVHEAHGKLGGWNER